MASKRQTSQRSSPLEAFATEVVRTLDKAGYRALFAGGCVRDRLLGKEPKDYDVATSATPDEVQALFKRTVEVGKTFGVVRVLGKERENPPQVEVATFRTESGYSDGRHPDQVAFSNEVEDVKRRDFTINGLLYDPLKDEVVDHVGGREDLQRRRIRAIGDPRERFREDKLRLLRAIRFAANLGFEIDGPTLAAIRKEAPTLTQVSAERIRDELVKLLTGADPRRGLELLKETRLLKHVLPDVEGLAGVPQPPEFHPEGDVWVHTLLLLGQLENPSETLVLGALLHDVGKPATFTETDRIRFNEHEKVGAQMSEKILKELRFPNETVERVTELVRQHMAFKDAPHMRPARLKRFLRMPRFEEHLELHRIDCLACHGKLDTYEWLKEKLAAMSQEQLKPKPLLTGEDLKRLGLAPGPRFKAILTDVEDRQLEGSLASRQEALEYVRKTYVNG